MSSRILLINFTQKESEKFADFPLTIDRGYLSDVKSTSRTANSDTIQEHLEFYFPHSIYEYKAVFLNLNTNAEIEKEFSTKKQSYPEKMGWEFYQYYTKNGVVIAFLGDYKYSHLLNLGMLGVTLEPVSDKDITPSFSLSEDTNFKKTLNSFLSEIVMPTNQYIFSEGEYYEKNKGNFALKVIYRNLGRRILGCYHNARAEWYNEDTPSFILLPEFKNNVQMIKQLLKELAKIYTKLLPELYEPDWIDSEKYYPNEISYYDKEKDTLIEKVTARISELTQKKEEAKKKYASLRGLLHQSGDELKTSVVSVLQDIFNLKVTDMDKNKDGSLNNEDILIEIGSRKILAEIKGVNQENPSVSYISQVWKHLHHNSSKGVTEGALILNYDLKTDPDDRHLAYTGELEKEIDDIIFIDTRVLFSLGLAVIDYGMIPEEAHKVLFKKGRVGFDLEEYVASKNQPKTSEVASSELPGGVKQ